MELGLFGSRFQMLPLSRILYIARSGERKLTRRDDLRVYEWRSISLLSGMRITEEMPSEKVRSAIREDVKSDSESDRSGALHRLVWTTFA